MCVPLLILLLLFVCVYFAAIRLSGKEVTYAFTVAATCHASPRVYSRGMQHKQVMRKGQQQKRKEGKDNGFLPLISHGKHDARFPPTTTLAQKPLWDAQKKERKNEEGGKERMERKECRDGQKKESATKFNFISCFSLFTSSF